MITIEESFPNITDSYLFGQDIFWEQFNEVNFYVEDTELQELYHQILKKLFPTMKIERIFPLNGKKTVIDEAIENIGHKKKVYIVDKDFDDLHNRIEHIDNLFYLDRYCIENYFFEEISILEFVISENPKLKRKQILEVYNFNDYVNDILEKLLYINSLFYIVQKCSLPFENTSLHIACFLQKNQIDLCQEKIGGYKTKLLEYIENNSLEIDLENAINENIDVWKEQNIVQNNICGKQILYLLLLDLKRDFGIKKLPDHYSACYRLAKECKFDTLLFLKENILNFLN
jgi:hypothetical protein